MKYDVPWVLSLSSLCSSLCSLCVAFHISMSMCLYFCTMDGVYVIIIMSFFSLPSLAHCLSLSLPFFLGESKLFFLFEKKTLAHSHFLRSIQRTINDHFTLTYLLLNMIVVKRKLNTHALTHTPRDR